MGRSSGVDDFWLRICSLGFITWAKVRLKRRCVFFKGLGFRERFWGRFTFGYKG